jgi:hypothetical protein
MSDANQPEDQGGAVKSTAVGCLGILCAMVAYVLTIGFADMLYASTGLPSLDETGALGMTLGIGPPAWIAFGIAVVLAILKNRFLWIAGSGAIVALAALIVAWLTLSG